MHTAGLDSVANLSADDLTCAICCSIFVKPVLLPCGHGFCLGCFNGVIAFNSLCCPCCRRRFGNWLRKASRDQSLINESLWAFVQRHFSRQLEKENLQPTSRSATGPGRIEGKLRSRCTDVLPTTANTTTTSGATGTSSTAAAPTAGAGIAQQVSRTGEIRKEFEAQYEKFQKELEKERQNELRATQEFIVKLLEDELNALQSKLQCTLSPRTSNEIMLVANPSHAPYTLSSTKGVNSLAGIQSEIKKNVHASLSNSNTILHNSSGTSGIVSQATSSSSTAAFLAQTAKCNIIKTLAVRLNRGTDIIKQSVHKAIISKIPQTFLSGSNSREVLTVPPTTTHREPNSSANSTDSLRLEMCHFKPIRTVPTTPNKKNHEDTLRTPKAKRLPKFKLDHCSRQSSDIKPSLLQQSLKRSPRRSAFCLVGASPFKTAGWRNTDLHPNVPLGLEEHQQNRKNPVVLMKRINAAKAKTSVQKDQANAKLETPRRNGVVTDALQGYKCRKINSDESKTIEEDKLEKLIKEQKRCEEIIEQEKLDFELAKKLQTELNAEPTKSFDRKNLRKRRNLEDLTSIDPKTVMKQTPGPSVPPLKRCRRTCGRILSFKETEAVETIVSNKTAASRVKCDKKSQQHLNTTSLRRSIRKSKPTRRYIV